MTNTPITVREFEKIRGERNHNYKAMVDLCESVNVDREIALEIATEIDDRLIRYGYNINKIPSAYLYKKTLDEVAFFKEMCIE